MASNDVKAIRWQFPAESHLLSTLPSEPGCLGTEWIGSDLGKDALQTASWASKVKVKVVGFFEGMEVKGKGGC